MKHKVIIDIGHQNADSGACANDLREVDLNLQVANTCVIELRRHGIEVITTAGTLAGRVKKEHEEQPELFISIHCNAGGGDGTEAWVYGNVFPQKGLAQNILDAIDQDGCNNLRGIKDCKGTNKELYVLKNTYCPATLIECAFIDSQDVECIDEPQEQRAFGIAIAKGILKTLNISYIKEEQTAVAATYQVIIGTFSKKENAVKLQNTAKEKGFDAYVKCTKGGQANG